MTTAMAQAVRIPRVSVVMPTQGRRASLGAALQSVRNQTCSDFELLLVDDSPADGPALAERAEWREHLADPRVRVVSWRRGVGCSAAKQAGLAAARAPWVAYLDDDNRMRPERLARALAVAESTPALVVLCGFEAAVAGRRRRRQHRCAGFIDDERLLRAVPDTNVLMHRREAGVSWEPDLRTGDDAVLFHRLVAAQPEQVVPNVPAPLVEYRVHDGVRANADPEAIFRGNQRLLEVAMGIYGLTACAILMGRMAVTQEKFRRGAWRAFGRSAADLLGVGGAAELRLVLNAALFKFAPTRRWVVR